MVLGPAHRTVRGTMLSFLLGGEARRPPLDGTKTSRWSGMPWSWYGGELNAAEGLLSGWLARLLLLPLLLLVPLHLLRLPDMERGQSPRDAGANDGPPAMPCDDRS